MSERVVVELSQEDIARLSQWLRDIERVYHEGELFQPWFTREMVRTVRGILDRAATMAARGE
jgi:hypothetical protein